MRMVGPDGAPGRAARIGHYIGYFRSVAAEKYHDV
jgi:hypothetical protein